MKLYIFISAEPLVLKKKIEYIPGKHGLCQLKDVRLLDVGVNCNVDANLNLAYCLSWTTGNSILFSRILQLEVTRINDMRVKLELEVFHGD